MENGTPLKLKSMGKSVRTGTHQIVLHGKVGIGSDPCPPRWDKIPTLTKILS